MKQPTFVFALFAIFCLIVQNRVAAQVPSKISYQAVVRDTKGSPVQSQKIGYRISILKGSETGEIAYSQAGDCMSNENGLITIELGTGTYINDINWGDDVYFMKTEIDPEGGGNYTIIATSQLLSVPYAQYSAKAGNGYISKNNSVYIGKGRGSSSTGEMNVYIGDSAGYKNTTGTRNTAVGYLSSYSITTGEWNTSIGSRSLVWNTSGKGNTATGHRTLFSNNTGYYNTASGFYALHNNTTGYSNVALGTNALQYNTNRSNLVAIGDSALYWNGTGASGNYESKENTAIGSKALFSNTTGFENTANGYKALFHNNTGTSNTANGTHALYLNTTGYGNTAIGGKALFLNISGYCNTAIGYHADVTSGNLNNATAVGQYAQVNANNKVRIGNSSVTVIEGQADWSVGSDIRLKNNVVYHNKLGLGFINDLKTVSFTYKNDSTNAHHDGLIAQDVQETMNKLGVEFSGLIVNDNEEKILNLSYAEFVIPLINSVQEQQKQIEACNLTIAAQQKQIDELKHLVENLTK